MKKSVMTIASNRPIARGVFELVLRGEFGHRAPGQFMQISLPGRFLRRPFSVCRADGDSLTAVYKIAGGGTEALSRMEAGEALDVLTGLGNGFDTSRGGGAPLLVGGGTGVSPLLGLCAALRGEGRKVTAILGFGKADEVFCADKFAALGADVRVTTADGGAGLRGLAPDAMDGADYTFIYACGPAAMLEAVNAKAASGGQFSLEARMGCGFGACMGCTIMTADGPRRVCRDGPVFDREEIIWPTQG
jgi:dihydroorotate dehydrogenase electron transfer subunit